MKPTVGRIVHYLDREQVVARKENAQPFAAVITQVTPAFNGNPVDTVDLGLFHPELGYQRRQTVPQGDGPGTWNWPPREETGSEKKKK